MYRPSAERLYFFRHFLYLYFWVRTCLSLCRSSLGEQARHRTTQGVTVRLGDFRWWENTALSRVSFPEKILLTTHSFNSIRFNFICIALFTIQDCHKAALQRALAWGPLRASLGTTVARKNSLTSRKKPWAEPGFGGGAVCFRPALGRFMGQ